MKNDIEEKVIEILKRHTPTGLWEYYLFANKKLIEELSALPTPDVDKQVTANNECLIQSFSLFDDETEVLNHSNLNITLLKGLKIKVTLIDKDGYKTIIFTDKTKPDGVLGCIYKV